MSVEQPENKAAIREIFLKALETQAPAERAAYLQGACGKDAALRAKVDALLSSHENDSFLESPAVEVAERAVVTQEPLTEGPGTVIGRYKLREKIGEGGFGIVYLAEQREPVKRRVALKIIKVGMDTREVVARFEAERQALAMMDHPNIAKVFDAGSTEAPVAAGILPAVEPGFQPGEEDYRDFPRAGSSDAKPGGRMPPSLAGKMPAPLSAGRPYFVMELVRGINITYYCDEKKLSTQARLDLFIKVCQAVQHAHQKGIIHRDLKPSNILVTVNDGQAVPKVIDFGIAKATQAELTEKTVFTRFQQFIGTPAYMSPEQAEMTSMDIDTRSDIYSLGVLLYELLTGQTPFDAKELLSAGLDEMRRMIRETEPVKPSTRLTRELERTRSTLGSARASRAESGAPPDSSSVRSPNESQGKEVFGEAPKTAREERALPDQSKKLIAALRGDLDWIVMKCLEKDRNRRYETASNLAADIQRHLNTEPIVARPPSTVYRLQKTIRRNKLAFAATAAVTLALLIGIAISSWQAVLARRSERKARAVTDFLVDELLKTNPYSESEVDPGKEAFAERVSRALSGRFTNDPLIEAELRLALGGLSGPKAVGDVEKALAIRQHVLGPAHPDTLAATAALAWRYAELGRRADARNLLTNALAIVRKSSDRLSPGAAQVLFSQGVLLQMENRPAEALALMEEALSVISPTASPKDWRQLVRLGHFAYAATDAGKMAQAEKLWNQLVQQCETELGPDNPMTAQALMGKSYLLAEQGRLQEARPLLERIIRIFKRMVAADDMPLINCEETLARCYEQSGDTATAAKMYSDLYPRLTNRLSYPLISLHCREMANFFARHHDYAQARQCFRSLREWFEKNPPETGWEFEIFVEATAATKGWPAVAEIWRKNFDRSSDSLSVWLDKAWIFRYVGDEESYRQVVRKVLALAPTAKTLDEQRWVIEIARLGPLEPSADQVKQLDSLVQALQLALPRSTTNQQVWNSRAIARLQLRLGRLQECLATFEKSAAQETPLERGFSLMTRALCLHRSGNADAARAAFDESEAIIMPTLPEPLSQNEGFMLGYQLNYLTLRREAHGLLASTQPKP